MANERDNKPFDLADFENDEAWDRKDAAETARETMKRAKAVRATERPFNQLRALSVTEKALRAPTMPNPGFITNVERVLWQESAMDRFFREERERQKRMDEVLGVRAYYHAFNSLNEELDRMRSALDVTGAFEGYGESFRILNDAFPDRWRELRDVGAARMLDMLEEANKHWQKLCEPVSSVNRFMKEEEERRKAIDGWSRRLYQTGTMLAGLDYNAMSAHLRIERPLFAGLEKSVQVSVRTFSDLALSWDAAADMVGKVLVLPSATDSIHATGLSLRSLQGEDADELEEYAPILSEEDPECMGLLASVDPGFLKMLSGAWDSLKGHNPDKERHVLASLRELLGDLLRHLTPDENLMPWISAQETQSGLLDKGKPTRQARIRFLCRNKANSVIEPFLRASIKEFAELIELLNGMHNRDIALADNELKVLIYAAEAKVKFLINVAKECK